jgi:hypothetical protein
VHHAADRLFQNGDKVRKRTKGGLESVSRRFRDLVSDPNFRQSSCRSPASEKHFAASGKFDYHLSGHCFLPERND